MPIAFTVRTNAPNVFSGIEWNCIKAEPCTKWKAGMLHIHICRLPMTDTSAVQNHKVKNLQIHMISTVTWKQWKSQLSATPDS